MSLIRIALGLFFCLLGVLVQNRSRGNNLYQPNPPGISGALVEGRVIYDCFCMDNKKSAIYVQSVTAAAKSK